jgi:transcriptional regulator with XRE-family HTH domain
MSKAHLPTGNEVRETRLSLGFTQKEAAEICTITPTSWARYEQGQTQMPSYIWELFTVKVAYTKMLEAQTNKPEKLTVYDKKKADQEAEEERKRLQQERYQQKIDERDRIEQERRTYLRGHIADLKERVGRKYPQVHKDFLDAESAYEITNAILKIENYYKQYRAEIDALTPDLLPYEFLANVVKFAQAE